MRLSITIIWLFAGLLCQPLFGQLLERQNRIVEEEGVPLLNPFAGGINEGQFSQMDLNQDGNLDLVVFDRSCDCISPFLKEGAGYRFAPEFISLFPKVRNWMLLKDYNADGWMDLFTHIPEDDGIGVYTQQPEGDIRFTLSYPLLDPIGPSPLFVPATDIPAIEDLDGDGDLDILAFDPLGSFANWFQNTAIETVSRPDTFILSLTDPCWGLFREEGLTNNVFLNESCRPNGLITRGIQHAGSTLTLLPQPNSVVKDLILGDISHENMVYLHNGGSPVEAVVDSASTTFPNPTDPIELYFFPAAFAIDITGDSIQDLIVAPNAPGASDNFNNIWLYRGEEQGNSYSYKLAQKNFLQETMVDCGAHSQPSLVDVNGDGLLDLAIGNKAYQEQGELQSASITLYENIGTPQEPRFSLTSRDYIPLDPIFPAIIQDIRPTFGDLDHDGDPDMILGDINGQLHFFSNDPQGQTARFSLTEFRFFDIDIGQNATPFLIDVNLDGTLDLVVGEFNGTLNYFENSGTPEAALFSSEPTQSNWGGVDVSPECCTGLSVPSLFRSETGELNLVVGSETGELYLYEGIALEEETFTLSEGFPLAAGHGNRISPATYDLDGDRTPEWILGNARGGLGIFAYSPNSTVSHKPQPFFSKIKIFPNPSATPTLHIKLPLPDGLALNIQVVDMLGKTCFQSRLMLNQTETRIILPGLNAGLYGVILQDDQGHSLSKKWLYLPKH